MISVSYAHLDGYKRQGHTNPDWDAIGACLALGGALEKAGKQVQVILEKYADKYQLIPNGHLVLSLIHI